MLKRTMLIFLVAVLLFSLTGCATLFGRKSELKIQELSNQISVLEAQIKGKDQEIEDLRQSISQLEESRTKTIHSGKKKYIAEVKSRPTVRQIQMALVQAGYNPGKIDGKMGRQTRDAIKAFQTANNLQVDGRVGKQTWSLLKAYLYKKVK